MHAQHGLHVVVDFHVEKLFGAREVVVEEGSDGVVDGEEILVGRGIVGAEIVARCAEAGVDG